MSERTYLRVRRRRNAVAALKIQLDGILLEPEQDDVAEVAPQATHFRDVPTREYGPAADHLPDRRSSSTHPSKRSKKAIWRRVSVSDGEAIHHHVNRKRTYRVVDAILHDDHADENDDEMSNHKRRRLTLIQTRTDASAPWDRSSRNAASSNSASSTTHRNTTSRQQPYRILPPNERIVDDSLKQVFVGNTLVAEHYDLCCTDPRLAEDRDRWLAYGNVEHGNLLHACALWNDAAVAAELTVQPGRRRHGGTVLLLDSILHARDGEGRTPLQVAELCGNDAVVNVLREASGNDDDNDDGDSFAYDIYCLDGDVPNGMDCLEDGDAGPDDDVDTAPLDCELEGGVGYWDENGQLVLDMLPPRTMSEVSVADEDEYDDPNHEDWDGNDYPDDDDDVDVLSDDDEFFVERAHARRERGMDSDDDEGNFDAAYGIYGHEDGEEAAYAFEVASINSN